MYVVLDSRHEELTRPSTRGAVHALDGCEDGATVVFEAGPEDLWEAVAAGDVVVEGDDPATAGDRDPDEELTFGLRPAEPDEEPEPDRALEAVRAARAADGVSVELTDTEPRSDPETFVGERHASVEGCQLVFAERMLEEPGLVETVLTENRDDPRVRASMERFFEREAAFDAERAADGPVSPQTVEAATDAFAHMVLTRDRATRERLREADADPDNTVVVRGRAHRWFPEMLAGEERNRPVELTVPPDLYDRERMLDAFRDREAYDWGERLVLGEANERIRAWLDDDELGPVRVADRAAEAAERRYAAGIAGEPVDDVLPGATAYASDASADTDPAWTPEQSGPSGASEAESPTGEEGAAEHRRAGAYERLDAGEFAVLDATGERTDALGIAGFETVVDADEQGLAVGVVTDEGGAGLARVSGSAADDVDAPHAVAAGLAERAGVSMGFVTDLADEPALDRLVVVGADQPALDRLDVAADVRFGGVGVEHAPAGRLTVTDEGVGFAEEPARRAATRTTLDREDAGLTETLRSDDDRIADRTAALLAAAGAEPETRGPIAVEATGLDRTEERDTEENGRDGSARW